MSAEQAGVRLLPETFESFSRAVDQREEILGSSDDKFHEFSHERGVEISVRRVQDPRRLHEQRLVQLNNAKEQLGEPSVAPDDFPYTPTEPWIDIEFCGPVGEKPKTGVIFTARITESNKVLRVNSRAQGVRKIDPVQIIETIREHMGIGFSRN